MTSWALGASQTITSRRLIFRCWCAWISYFFFIGLVISDVLASASVELKPSSSQMPRSGLDNSLSSTRRWTKLSFHFISLSFLRYCDRNLHFLSSFRDIVFCKIHHKIATVNTVTNCLKQALKDCEMSTSSASAEQRSCRGLKHFI